MNIGLNLHSRINIINLMPIDGSSWTDRQIITGLTAKLGVTAEEQETLAVAETEPDESGHSRMTWNELGNEDRQFDLHAKEIALIHAELTKLDKAEKLLPRHDSLCEKFLDEPDNK